MAENEKLDLILAEIQGMKSSMCDLKEDMQSVKADVQELKEDVQVLKEDMQSVKADVQGLKEEMQDVKADVQELKEDVQSLKEDVDSLKEDMQEVNGEIQTLDQKIKGIHLILENEICVNIQRVAEGHLDLSRNLHEAMKPNNEVEMLSIKVRKLESDMREVKMKVFG